MKVKDLIKEEVQKMLEISMTKKFRKAIEALQDVQLKQQQLQKAFVSEKDPKKKEKLKQALIKMHKFVQKAELDFNRAVQLEPVDDLYEAINKSDAKYTMKMVFDNHGFGKALKHMKILRSGITLNMSSYMGPSKTLDKIVKDFNDIMGTKYKADKDSFQKGHVTSIDLKEGKLTEGKKFKGSFGRKKAQALIDKFDKKLYFRNKKDGKIYGVSQRFLDDEKEFFVDNDGYEDLMKYSDIDYAFTESVNELDVRKTHGDKRIENPKTGNKIKLRTALKAKKGSKVYQTARKIYNNLKDEE